MLSILSILNLEILLCANPWFGLEQTTHLGFDHLLKANSNFGRILEDVRLESCDMGIWKNEGNCKHSKVGVLNFILYWVHFMSATQCSSIYHYIMLWTYMPRLMNFFVWWFSDLFMKHLSPKWLPFCHNNCAHRPPYYMYM